MASAEIKLGVLRMWFRCLFYCWLSRGAPSVTDKFLPCWGSWMRSWGLLLNAACVLQSVFVNTCIYYILQYIFALGILNLGWTRTERQDLLARTFSCFQTRQRFVLGGGKEATGGVHSLPQRGSNCIYSKCPLGRAWISSWWQGRVCLSLWLSLIGSQRLPWVNQTVTCWISKFCWLIDHRKLFLAKLISKTS